MGGRPKRGVAAPFVLPLKDKKNDENNGDYEMKSGGNSGNDFEKILGEFIIVVFDFTSCHFTNLFRILQTSD